MAITVLPGSRLLHFGNDLDLIIELECQRD